MNAFRLMFRLRILWVLSIERSRDANPSFQVCLQPEPAKDIVGATLNYAKVSTNSSKIGIEAHIARNRLRVTILGHWSGVELICAYQLLTLVSRQPNGSKLNTCTRLNTPAIRVCLFYLWVMYGCWTVQILFPIHMTRILLIYMHFACSQRTTVVFRP